MSDTQHAPGPWKVEESTIGNDGTPYAYYIVANGGGWNCVVSTFADATDTNVRLITRLANLYFSGTARAEKRTDVIEAIGGIPADPDYGLTENEIAAARMMNALMDENAELLEALEGAHDIIRRNGLACPGTYRDTIAKAKGGS